MNTLNVNKKKIDKADNKGYKWVVWGILAIIYAVVFFHRLSIGIIREELMSEFNINSMTFANIGAVYFYVYMLMQIPSGVLVDLYGARRLVTVGTLIAGIGSIVFSVAYSLIFIFIGRFMVGLGVSVVFIPILKIQSIWFDEREFGTVTGLTSFVGNLGGVLAQTPLALMVYYFSWRVSFLIIGVFTIVLSILCIFIVKDSPEIINNNERKNNDIKEMVSALRNVITNKNTWPPFIVFAALFGSFIAFTGTWGRTYLIEVYKISKLNSANYTLAATLGLSFSCVIIGKISDALKRRKNIVIICMLVNLICWMVVVYGVGNISMIGLFFVTTVLGSTCSAVVMCFALAKETNHSKFVGISTSIVNMGGFVGAALIPVIIGKYLDNHSSELILSEAYQNGFKVCLVSMIIGTVVSFLIKETHCRNIYND